ncbi:hypothetical protein GOP47_0001758 [Adiantum capillus-veneris]|uniref:Protein phosphatase 1 regulatory subunit pprA n=1 Tax=Adiantum capillus-veneris TaxID=13818 RepID=A0A9D4ZR04_ADICA|nr:hypothetical protein GOP47_0001758 [Adiantum capillus-veneris]
MEEDGAGAVRMTGGKEQAQEEEEGGVVLDLTGSQLHDLQQVELPLTLRELDLTANRLATLDCRFASLSSLYKLSLRQNLLSDESLSPLPSWTSLSGLQELVLRDNKLTKLPNVEIFTNLRVFDVSFNEVTSLKGLSNASSNLRELYVSKNEVVKMEELEHLHSLELLELGSNKLRVMENLHTMVKLKELWLGRNRIRTVNLCGLNSLVKISLQSNRLTSILGFQDCVCLEELYLSHNGITKMEGVSTLLNLRILDLSSNKIACIEDIKRLPRLEDLWLNDNQIASLEGIGNAVGESQSTLTTIYIERNPCATDADYATKLKALFPNLQQVDSVLF